jgi:ABC-type glycerol-3-phosphate transport system substrate-binding protein
MTKRSVNRGAPVAATGQTGPMRGSSPRSLRRRTAAALLAGGLVLAACGGGSDSSTGTEVAAPPDVTELDPASDTATNQLPDVVVDDLIAGNKVNLRNFAPADTAILVWMWAPH